MVQQRRRRVLWPRLGGVLVFFDGILGLLLAVLFVTFSRFVGAIEGQAPREEPWLLGALIAFAVSIAGFWAGQRAIRAIRRGRLVGVAVASIVAAYVANYVVTGDPGSVESTIAWSAFAGLHAAAALALFAWPAEPVDRTLPAAVGTGRA